MRLQWVVLPLWFLAEVAIAATDLAEIIGSATALNLLFNIPLWGGVLITAVDVLFIIAFGMKNFRVLEVVQPFVGCNFHASLHDIELSWLHPISQVLHFMSLCMHAKLCMWRISCGHFADSALHMPTQALVLLLCATIFACFVYELAAVKPAWLDVAKGFIPRADILTDAGMLYTAIGILGACHSA